MFFVFEWTAVFYCNIPCSDALTYFSLTAFSHTARCVLLCGHADRACVCRALGWHESSYAVMQACPCSLNETQS